MSWDEHLFGHLYRLARRLRPAPPADGARVALEPLRPRLQLLAGLLSGEAVEDLGALRLPEELVLDTLEQGVQLYVYRVVLEGWRLRQRVFLPAEARRPEQRLLATLASLPQAWQEIEQELPGCAALRQQLSEVVLRRRQAPQSPRAAALEEQVRRTLRGEALGEDAPWGPLPGEAPPPVLLWGELGPERQRRVPAGAPVPAQALPSGSERPGRRRQDVRARSLQEDREGENPLVHVFEKVRTAEEYRGGHKPADGSDELEDQLEALEELDLRELVRSHSTTRSIYQADLPAQQAPPDLLAPAAAPGEVVHRYDEWDQQRHAYHRDHCQVHAAPPPPRLSDEQAGEYVRTVLQRNQRQLRALRLAFERIAREQRWRDRCGDGPEVDIDAVVERHAALRGGHAPPDRLYLARRPQRPRLATLVLIDSSLSTDGWVRGRRVLDVAREAVLTLGEVLCGVRGLFDPRGGQVAIGAFHSHTRHDCRYWTLKDFYDPWELGQRRVAQLAPAGYTRIGPALRHAVALLQRVPAQRRLLLLISDGKPTDYDRYEGTYGMADVRKAVQEAQQQRVLPFALAIDAQARSYLPRIFGHGNYEILPEPAQLTLRMARLWVRLLHTR